VKTIQEIKTLKSAGKNYRDISKITGASLASISKYSVDIASPNKPMSKQVKSSNLVVPSFSSKPIRSFYRAIPVEGNERERTFRTPVVISHQRNRALDNIPQTGVSEEKPVLTPLEQEQETFSKKRFIDVSHVYKINKEIRNANRETAYKEKRFQDRLAFDRRMRHALSELNTLAIEQQIKKDREINEYLLSDDGSISREDVRDIAREMASEEESKMHNIADAFGRLKSIENAEEVRLKQKKIDDKFITDVLPAVIDFIGLIVKSLVVMNKKKPRPLPAIVLQ